MQTKRPGRAVKGDTQSASGAEISPALLLFAGTDVRLPSRCLLAWRRGNGLDFLLLGLLGFPIALLLTFGHADLLWCVVGLVDDAVNQCGKFTSTNSAPHFLARRRSRLPIRPRRSHEAMRPSSKPGPRSSKAVRWS